MGITVAYVDVKNSEDGELVLIVEWISFYGWLRSFIPQYRYTSNVLLIERHAAMLNSPKISRTCKLSDASPWSTAMPFYLVVLVYLSVATGSFVCIEPALCDICMALVTVLVFVNYMSIIFNKLAELLCLVCIFFILQIPGTFFIQDDLQAIRTLLIRAELTFYSVAIAAIVIAHGRAMRSVLVKAYLHASALAILWGFAQYIDLLPESIANNLFPGRMTGLFKDPNVLGPFLIPTILICIHLWLVQGKFRWLVMMGLGLVGVFLSYSRAAWGAALASIIVFSLGTVRVRKAIAVIGAVAIVISVAIACSSVDDGSLFKERAQLFQPYDNDRFDVHTKILVNVVNYPFGMGPGQIENNYMIAAHSTYLRALGEGGVMFLFIFAFLLYRATKVGFSTRFASRLEDRHFAWMSIATMLSILIAGIVVDTMHWRHMWLFIGMSYGQMGCCDKAHNSEVNVSELRLDNRPIGVRRNANVI